MMQILMPACSGLERNSPTNIYLLLCHRLLTSRNGIGNASRAHVDRRTITVVPTSFRRQCFRKDLNISVKGNNYALLTGFQTTYFFLLRALESVLVLGKSWFCTYLFLLAYGRKKRNNSYGESQV